MGDDGSGVRRVAGLHPAEEGQEGGRVLWYAMVRPRRELELTNLPLLTRAILQRTDRAGLNGVVAFGGTDQLVLFSKCGLCRHGALLKAF